MRNLVLCALSAFFLCLLAIRAKAQGWLLVDTPGSCSVTDIDFSDVSHGFAVGAFNCGLLSNDGGLTWQAVDVAPQQGQSLMWGHAESVNRLWAARNELYRSNDRGLTWVRMGGDLNGAGGSITDIAVPAPDRMVMIKGGQIQFSQDGGQGWIIAYPGEFGVAFDELHFPSSGVGYASGGRGFANTGNVLKSTDGGLSWALLTFSHGKITAATFTDPEHGLVATQNLDVYATSDGAASWQLQGSLGGQYVTDMVSRGEDHFYAATTLGCILESHDDGKSWVTEFCDSQGRALATLSAAGSAVVAAGNDGLVVYEDRIFEDDFDQAGR